MLGKANEIVIKLFFLLIATNIALSHHQSSNLLSNLISGKSNEPLVLVISNSKTFDNDELNNVPDDDVSTSDSGEAERFTYNNEPGEDTAYMLYNYLRTNPHDELTSKASDLEETKQLLRQALRARCRKLDGCVRKCPKKKPKCPLSCKDTFDDLDLCPEEITPEPSKDDCNKRKKKRGKTMPPSWK